MNELSSMTDYRSLGFEIISGLFTQAEIERFQADAERLYTDPNVMTLRDDRTITRRSVGGGQVIDRLDPVIDISPVFAGLASDQRMLDLAEESLGEPCVLFKDKLIFKQPGAHGYEIHQDFTAWQELGIPPAGIVSLMVAIDPAHQQNGAVEFYPGLHQDHLVDGPLATDVFSTSGCVVDEAALAGVQPVPAEAAAGDVLAIHALAPHRSSPNFTSEPRRAIFLTYTSARYGDHYDAYYERFREYRRRSVSL